jgi:hypothetical protein
MAGYNTVIPFFGKPSPNEIFFIRAILGVSLFIGTATSVLVFVLGTSIQKVVGVVPAMLFGCILFFLMRQLIL